MLQDIGLLDETFFCYYEDTDLSWRMRLRRWRVIYQPKAVIEHLHSGTSVEWSPFFIFHVDRNRLFMILKNAPRLFVGKSILRFALLSASSALRAFRRRLGNGEGSGAVGPGLSRARIQVRVLASLVRHLPEMLAKRRHIRKRRTVNDVEIIKWFYPRELWDKKFGR
jgi:N-acetylglucosaminyl-diphospho-decaprenol L-rhamnosyltransferase